MYISHSKVGENVECCVKYISYYILLQKLATVFAFWYTYFHLFILAIMFGLLWVYLPYLIFFDQNLFKRLTVLQFLKYNLW